jgi:LuxR family transcriptional regulator/LuxR family quorum-sensing system transcriptional regulator CciR
MQEFHAAVTGASTFGELRKACIKHFKRLGVSMMSYHHMPPPGIGDYNAPLDVFAEGFPQDWVHEYVKNRYYDFDPIPKYAQISSKPFWWTDIRSHPDLTEEERGYLDRLEQVDLGDGLAIPVFGPHGRNGYSALGFGKNRPNLSDFEISQFQWCCQLGHQRYSELLRRKASEDIHLSNREHEILQWVVRGKSNSVIADIIGISSHTVDTYMRRLYMKLEVSDRVTAALRGLAIGVIA